MLSSCIHAGAGIHVTNSELTYSSSSLPNNSIILVNTDTHGSYSRYRRMGFYCCSNFTSGYSDIGTFIGVDGRFDYHGKIRIEQYYYTSLYAGCMHIYLDQSYYSQNQISSSEEGIYTCRMRLGRNSTSDVSIGIYRDQGESTGSLLHITVNGISCGIQRCLFCKSQYLDWST